MNYFRAESALDALVIGALTAAIFGFWSWQFWVGITLWAVCSALARQFDQSQGVR